MNTYIEMIKNTNSVEIYGLLFFNTYTYIKLAFHRDVVLVPFSQKLNIAMKLMLSSLPSSYSKLVRYTCALMQLWV